MMDSIVFKDSFNRDNLFYEVRPKFNIEKEIIQFVKARKGKSGIVYCLSRKKVEEVSEFLNVNDIKSLPYLKHKSNCYVANDKKILVH